jgi:hypothetical protein
VGLEPTPPREDRILRPANSSRKGTIDKEVAASPEIPLARESQKGPPVIPSTSPQTDPTDADLVRLMALWPDLPEAGKEQLQAQAQLDCEAVAPLIAKYRKSPDDVLQSLLGESLPRLTESRQYAEEALQSGKPEVRIGSVLLIKDRWRPTRGLGPVLERLAFFDPDTRVRGAAVLCLLRHGGVLLSSSPRADIISEIIAACISASDRARLLSRMEQTLSESPQGGYQPIVRQIAARWAGAATVQRMCESREITGKFLQDPDPGARIGALILIHHQWNAAREYAELIERLAFDDVEREVRRRRP